jgi:hypothetical protein
MAAINQLFQIAYGVELFRSMERPREWGWVLRPSTNEWQHLVHTTDKLLSENLNQKALDAVEARTVNDDGSAAGSLNRLGFYLEDTAACPLALVKQVLKPLKEVRKERQKPAHALVVAATDATITAQQRDLLNNIAGALHLLRQLLQQHPRDGRLDRTELPGRGRLRRIAIRLVRNKWLASTRQGATSTTQPGATVSKWR